MIYALMLLLAIIISLIIAYDNFHSYWEDDRVRVVTKFQGVKLGWTKDEVLFHKGEPSSVDVKNDKETYLDYGATGIMLEKGIVVKILYVCQDSYSYEKVGGISCDSDISRIIKQYGDSKKLATSEDKLSRIYNYPNYNLAFMLSKAKVEMLAVFDSTKVPNGFSFGHVGKKDSFVLENSKPFTDEENAEFQARYDAENKVATSKVDDDFDPDTNLAKKSKSLHKGEDLEALWAQAKPDNKNIDDKSAAKNEVTRESKVEFEDVDYDPFNLELDHCAPDLTKTERLRRLALKGTVRETGYQTYSTGNYEIVFSAGTLYHCK